MAFHQPRDLEDERRDLLDRMGGLPSRDDALERGLKMLEQIAKVDARREAAIGEPVGEAPPPEVKESGSN